ncbi:FAD/NAD(P)-binding domain-containing protein [Aspergillus coremiiformis]|uniref:FAD/NAD(P)-binding domain-containing protein n=1 Tax=Aspergillus coremiiformis TaxID=138285 RepID=A0A5N6ZIY6_9EURO|nr:FAD/NAD(P)-binding domain-containing protein [Aspergillus coremiiformis]
MTTIEDVAIIGAGLSGLTLALALHSQSIPCTVYEGRSAPEDIGGAIVLSPNALQILDTLAIYPSIKHEGYECETVVFRTQDDQIIDAYEIGNEEKYGYKALRIYRHIIIRELLRRLSENHIPVHYGKKFLRICAETESQVTWEFSDGSTGRAGSVVGADGIHSRVRQYLYPQVKPRFLGIVAVAATVPSCLVDIPRGYHLPAIIMSPTHPGYIIGSQHPDASEVMLGRQARSVELDRDGWDALIADTRWCIDFLSDGAEGFPPVIRSTVAHIRSDRLNVWPFYVVPRLDGWASDRGRVTILGDAAHAIPPSSGQGANQVFEDVWTYALVRGRGGGAPSGPALRKWSRGRQERIDQLLGFAEEMNRRRMINTSSVEKTYTTCSMTEYLDLEWVFTPDYPQMVQDWLESSGP